MKIPAQPFFRFCSNHVPLLRALAEHQSDLTEAETRTLVRSTSGPDDERPETTWQRLIEYQILVPTEVESDLYLMARPVSRLIAYLFDEAQAATPEIIRGYIQSLESLNKQFSRAIDDDSVSAMRLSLEELQHTLQRIQGDVEETHRAIGAEISSYKSQRRNSSMRERFRRIIHWMERYIDPMVDIFRADGPLRATLDETERLLRRAREQSMFSDLPLLELSSRRVRLVARQALRVFQQCRQELRPLYEAIRRASFIAEGAAIALERLQRNGLNGWPQHHVVPVHTIQFRHAPSDGAIKRCIQNVVGYTPQPPPTVDLDGEETTPDDFLHQQWLLGLPEQVRGELPVRDLLAWITTRHPDKGNSDVLSAFTHLVYHPKFSARFTGTDEVDYQTSNGVLCAGATELVIP